MDIVEIEQRETLSREEAAKRLIALGEQIAKQNDVEFERGGVRFTVHVPDEVHLKLELEVGDDESELEVELTW